MGVRRIASEARHVRDMWIEVDAPGREAQAQVIDPSPRRLSRELLLLDERPLNLRQQLLTPEEIQQSQLCGDASHQLVQDAREDDVGVEDRSWPPALVHSGGAPIASSSRDHSAVRRSCSALPSSNASSDENGIFQWLEPGAASPPDRRNRSAASRAGGKSRADPPPAEGRATPAPRRVSPRHACRRRASSRSPRPRAQPGHERPGLDAGSSPADPSTKLP